MRYLLFLAAIVITGGLAWRWRCGWLHETTTARDPATGGRRCIRCGKAYASIAASGELDGSAFLRPMKSGAFFKDGAHGVTTEPRH